MGECTRPNATRKVLDDSRLLFLASTRGCVRTMGRSRWQRAAEEKGTARAAHRRFYDWTGLTSQGDGSALQQYGLAGERKAGRYLRLIWVARGGRSFEPRDMRNVRARWFGGQQSCGSQVVRIGAKPGTRASAVAPTEAHVPSSPVACKAAQLIGRAVEPSLGGTESDVFEPACPR